METRTFRATVDELPTRMRTGLEDARLVDVRLRPVSQDKVGKKPTLEDARAFVRSINTKNVAPETDIFAYLEEPDFRG